LNDARNEINLWRNEQQAKLDAECDTILKDAIKQADEIERSQIAKAKGKNIRELTRLCNKYVDESCEIFQHKLDTLRERSDYKEILTGLAFEAIKKIPCKQNISLKLSAADVSLGEEIAGIINDVVSINMTFDPAPGDFEGGVVISSADGRWSVISDWRTITEETTDTIASRVLATL
jgi:vacuolar-type H+-ATPase subunit E/Vma4